MSMTFGSMLFSRRQETSVSSSPFPVTFSFTKDMLENIEVPNLVPRLRIADCGGNSLLSAVILGHPMFLLEVWLYPCVSYKEPL